MHVHIALSLLFIIYTFVASDDPKVKGVAAASTLTMNQELEGHKGSAKFVVITCHYIDVGVFKNKI